MNISYLNVLKCKQTDLVKTLKWGDFRAQREFFSGLGMVSTLATVEGRERGGIL